MTGCSKTTDEDKQSTTLTVYTSIYPIHYVVEQIGGEAIDVHSVYPPGVDAHTYEPTTREMINIAKGDAFFYMGAGMEGFADQAKKTLANEDIQFIEIAAKDKTLFLKSDDSNHHEGDYSEDDHDHGDYDPHIWFDPLRMIQVAEIVTGELAALAPNHEKTFQHNLEIVTEQLTNLNEQYEETLQTKKNKQLLVAHAAYGYWEERYGIEQIPISGLSTSDEPSQKELADIVTFAKKNELQFVIFEQTGTDKVSEIIREHLGAEGLRIHNLESLTDEDIVREADYLSIMKENLNVLDQALK